MRRPSLHAALLLLLVVLLAVVAGVMARKALAADETYCNFCSLGATPAVSASRSTWYQNTMTTAPYYADEQVYSYYAPTDTTTCSVALDSVQGVGIGCSPSTPSATQRCHLLHGTGPLNATCDGYY